MTMVNPIHIKAQVSKSLIYLRRCKVCNIKEDGEVLDGNKKGKTSGDLKSETNYRKY